MKVWRKMENYNLDYVIMGTLSMWTLFKGQISFDDLCLYSAFLGTQSALHSKGGGSPHPPPVCSIHLFCSPHTRYRWREDRVMKSISFLSQLLIITIIFPSHTLPFKSLGSERFLNKYFLLIKTAFIWPKKFRNILIFWNFIRISNNVYLFKHQNIIYAVKQNKIFYFK